LRNGGEAWVGILGVGDGVMDCCGLVAKNKKTRCAFLLLKEKCRLKQQSFK
jgi:hypothetical protein